MQNIFSKISEIIVKYSVREVFREPSTPVSMEKLSSANKNSSSSTLNNNEKTTNSPSEEKKANVETKDR